MKPLRPLGELTYQGQVRRLKKFAHHVLATSYPRIDVEEVALLVHGENTTFKVTTKGGARYVLRIHRVGYQTTASIWAELAWLKWLEQEHGFLVPVVVPSDEGEALVFAKQRGIVERRCVLFEWIDGEHRREVALGYYKTMGGLMGKMHRLSPKVPKAIVRDRPSLMDRGFLTEEWHDHGGLLRPEVVTQLRRVSDAVAKHVEEVASDESQHGLIHSDLHLGNVMFLPTGEVALIDFDDALCGPFLYGMATAYLSIDPSKPTSPKGGWDAFLEGYQAERPLPKKFEHGLPLYLAARRADMVEWFLGRQDNSDVFKHFESYTEKLDERLEGLLRVWEEGEGRKN